MRRTQRLQSLEPIKMQTKKSDALENEVTKLREEMTNAISAYASEQPLVKQLIDLALLGNGLLRGEDLSNFINRSVSLL